PIPERFRGYSLSPRYVPGDVEKTLRDIEYMRVVLRWSWMEIVRNYGINRRTLGDFQRRLIGIDPDANRKRKPEPKAIGDITDEAVLAVLADTPDGFRSFCDRYWPEEP